MKASTKKVSGQLGRKLTKHMTGVWFFYSISIIIHLVNRKFLLEIKWNWIICTRSFPDHQNVHIYKCLNFSDFFVVISFVMQSTPKVPHLIHCFPLKTLPSVQKLQNLWPTSDSSSFDSRECFFSLHTENLWECTILQLHKFYDWWLGLESLETLLVLTFLQFHE